MTRAAVATRPCSIALLLAAAPLLSACVKTSLETGEHDPANPQAPALPTPEIPPTLGSGFDPNGDRVDGGSAPADDHQHHHHHHHEPEQHRHEPEPADGGLQ